ncbi:multiple PDZ domain protein-like [Centruroides vittatus]|uniref:multiple PDZ domain protein-like n=1 Tax=Centruroides sculpturatus TaxID=218467 RepID=UPI000C6EE3D3|nr:multiple PDZ domain protein-like [Centruroides sculpturatus]
MDLENLHYADETEDPYEVVLLPENIPSENRLSPCHAVHLPTAIALSTIQDFLETTIVIRKDKKNELGITVSGGSDTYLEQVCVVEVHSDGSASRDGRLKRGDVLLAVNDVSLRDVTAAEAVKNLREATSPVRLLVLRENPQTLFTSNESPSKFITVEFRKSSIKDRLGLSIIQRTNGRGVFVTYVQPGSIAARHGRRIMQGDRILEINGQNVKDSNQKDVAQMLQSMDGAIVLLLGRVPSLTSSIQEWAKWKAQICLRTRTSTWSAYTGNAKEKLQTQRPSLPVSKESTLGFPNCVTTVCSSCVESTFPSREPSPSSSIRRSRLSIVAEDFKSATAHTEEDHRDIDEFNASGSENPLLPSILVTSF